MEVYTYYSTERPISIGTHPGANVIAIDNYLVKTYVPEIEQEAWGVIFYLAPLTKEQMEEYELVQSEEQRQEIEGREVIKLLEKS